MTYKTDIDALDPSTIAQSGDSWSARVASYITAQDAALKAMAQVVEAQGQMIEANKTAAANADMSNVSESDIMRRLFDNPAAIQDGTIAQIRGGLFEPLAQSSLPAGGVTISALKEYDYPLPTSTPSGDEITPDNVAAALTAFYSQSNVNVGNAITMISAFRGTSGGVTTSVAVRIGYREIRDGI